MKRLGVLLILCYSLNTSLKAQTWTGAVGNDWFTAGNWSPATVPGSSSTAIIPGSLATYPTLSGNVTVANLTMSSGSALHLAGFTFTDNGPVSLTSAAVDGGGAFTVSGASSVVVTSSTLTTALSITGYTGGANIFDNTITGATTISDAASQANDVNWIDGNLINGSLNLTHASATNEMEDGYGSPAGNGNHITGNMVITISGAGQFQAAYSHMLTVDGNLTVNRTSSAGNTFLAGQGTAGIVVGGMFSVSSAANGYFAMLHVKNAVAGGAVSVSGATTLNVRNDTLKATVSITGYTGSANIFDNSFTGTTTISDASTQANDVNWIDGNLITGNLNLTHASAANEMTDGYGSPTANGNRITGNMAITISGAGQFQAAYNHPLTVGGNLTINRATATGNTIISGANVASVSVGGTVSGTITTAGPFTMLRTKNSTGGGNLSISNATYINVQKDTLITTFAITAYTGAANIFDNSFTGATTISDAASQASGTNYIDGNLFTGALSLTHASGTDVMYEGYGSPSGNANRVTGNATFNLTGAGGFYSSYSRGLGVGGNLSVSRTVAGYTNLFVTPGTTASVGGSFTYSTTGTGDNYINPVNTSTVPVGGSFSVTTGATTGVFRMYRMKSATASGTVSISSPSDLDIRNDTLNATVNITGYRGAGYVLDNSFTGSTTISDAATQNSGANYIDGNLFTGSLTLTHASATDDMYEGFASPSGNGNRVTGSATINLSGAGRFFSSYDHSLRVAGNLTINRTVAGYTNLYRTSVSTSSVGGNFSYISSGGDSYINENNGNVTLINGTITINASAAGAFKMYKVKNGLSGGFVSVAGSTSLDLQRDTLLATVNLTGYTNSCSVWDNSFTGATTIADAASQNSGYNYIDGNLFAGTLDLTHNSATDQMLEGYASPTSNANRVTGNAQFVIAGAGNFYSSYDHPIRVDGNLTVTRQTAGYTNLFRNPAAPGNVGGNLTVYIPYDNNTYINDGNLANVVIGGTVSVTTSGTGAFHMHHVKNNTTGGFVNVTGSSNVELRADTLKASLSVTAYTNACSIWDNSIFGAATIADASTQNSGYNYIDGNYITGNLQLTHLSSTDAMLEGYGSPSGNPNRILGNCTITLADGLFYSSHTHGLRVDGNFSVQRNNAGGSATYLFYNGVPQGSVGGNFSLITQNSNNIYINDGGATNVPVGGTFNVNAPLAGYFHMYRMKNLITGGTVSVSGATNLDVRSDSLAANLSLTRYSGPGYIWDNSITGNTLISDSTTQNSGANYIDGNRFAGNLTLIHNSTTDAMAEGYGAPSGFGNVVTGIDSIVKASGSAGMTISYNHPHEADGNFILNAPSGLALNSLTFGGATFSTVKQAGAQPISVPNIYLNKPSGYYIGLLSTMTVTSNLSFISGQIVASTAPIVFADNATHSGATSGASSSSPGKFVAGTVYKAGNDAFTFPLGYISGYNPAGISAPASVTDTFSAQYFPSGPHPTYDSSLHDASINHISKKEYWIINRVAGSSNVSVTLGYNSFNSGSVTDMSKLVVAHWYNNGASTSWHNEGNGATSGTNTLGSVTSSGAVSSFSPFTLGSTTIANPLGSPGVALPVSLIAFDAQARGKQALLTWQTADDRATDRYEVERSSDGYSYQPVGGVKANGTATEKTYELYDIAPFTGLNYYRLAIIGTDGSKSRSAVRTLQFVAGDAAKVTIYPNPATEVLNVANIAGWSGAQLTVRASNGQLLYRTLLTGEPGTTITTRLWPAGLYFLEVTDGTCGSTQTFIKR